MAWIVPFETARIEMVVEKSKFIATAGPAFSVEEARSSIQNIRNEFPDATHHVPAFIIGHGAGVTMHCSDDGEPSGTAGRPILAVLQGSGLGDIWIVVTRYFGGIKLGTGGLVRAYSEAAKEVLAVLPVAEKVVVSDVMMTIPYSLFERTRKLIEEFQGVILDEDFAGDVTISVRLREENVSMFCNGLRDLSRGQTNIVLVNTAYNSIMPIKKDTGT
ncbi:uncharacterized protein, YigZ family [Anaerolinea thermolimosa]|uniref:YigZ family protein n=1 Tax=Anaerolinea thermolimosa TaxID=229919 RepID=UPI000785EF68|nr:YigZ family protein [Anaerolinea thermolimosa]GAP06521.1 uncharacterized protein, YigZ family [Anaerolinea thermolimosa]